MFLFKCISFLSTNLGVKKKKMPKNCKLFTLLQISLCVTLPIIFPDFLKAHYSSIQLVSTFQLLSPTIPTTILTQILIVSNLWVSSKRARVMLDSGAILTAHYCLNQEDEQSAHVCAPVIVHVLPHSFDYLLLFRQEEINMRKKNRFI